MNDKHHRHQRCFVIPHVPNAAARQSASARSCVTLSLHAWLLTPAFVAMGASVRKIQLFFRLHKNVWDCEFDSRKPNTMLAY
jgi:hypothetical protein